MIHLVLADPFTMMAVGMGATLVGGGIGAYGKYQAGQAASRADTAQAQVAAQLAQAGQQAANVTEYAGGRAAERTGLMYRAAIGRQAVQYGASNIAGRTPSDVRASQVALGQLSERETMAKYGETAYQERLRAAEQVATAGRYRAAAGQDIMAGDIGAVGAAVSTVGESASVAAKWYQTAGTDAGSGSDPTLYPDPNYPVGTRQAIGYS